jgi:hypothetical protein
MPIITVSNTHGMKKQAAIDAINAVFADTTVSIYTTMDTLQELSDLCKELIAIADDQAAQTENE